MESIIVLLPQGEPPVGAWWPELDVELLPAFMLKRAFYW